MSILDRVANKDNSDNSDSHIINLVDDNPKYGDLSVNHQSSEFEVNNWKLSEFVMNELTPVVGVHPFPLTELMLMSASFARLKPDVVIEWGTHIGKASRIFYECAKHFGVDAKIYSIDLPDDAEHVEHPGNERGRLVKDYPQVTLVQGDGLDDSLRILKDFPKDAKVLFFIDGDHSYESVKREFGTLIETHPNAWFLLHDAFYQSEDSGYNVGPHKAIKESLEGKDHRVFTTFTGLPGMTLVYR